MTKEDIEKLRLKRTAVDKEQDPECRYHAWWRWQEALLEHADALLDAAEENERLREALEDMIGLAAALDDDDPYYGAQRVTARLESALAALKGGK